MSLADKNRSAALKQLERARAAPGDPGLWARAGAALAAVGEGALADQAFECYFALRPGQKLVAQGAERHRAGDLRAACDLYRQAMIADPRNADALRLFAVTAAGLGRPQEAETAARLAVRLAPDFSAAWAALGAVLSELDEMEEAVGAFRRALSLSPDSAEARANLANALFAFGDPSGAHAAYLAALALRPGEPSSLLGLGHVLKTIGKQAEAIAAYRGCLAARPDAGEAWWSLANLKTFRFDAADEARMTALLAGDLAENSRVGIAYALGKAREDAGDPDAAFARYAEGAALQRNRVRYDPGQTELMTDRLISVFNPDLFQAHAGGGCRDHAPIFIVGLPRSGSTLVEQILASHSQVDGTRELPILTRLSGEIGRFRSDGVVYPEAVCDLESDDFAALGEAYLTRADRYRGQRPFFTDKMPNNFSAVGLIALILPEAKIIDARRHPMDSCLGGFKQLFARGQTFTYDLFDLGHYYLQYDRLMHWWDTVLPGRVLRVDYESVVLDQEAQVRRLLEFCNLPFEMACLDFHKNRRAVNTASSEQVRQPLYTSALGTWHRFAPHLTDLENQLAPLLAALPPIVRDAGREVGPEPST